MAAVEVRPGDDAVGERCWEVDDAEDARVVGPGGDNAAWRRFPLVLPAPATRLNVDETGQEGGRRSERRDQTRARFFAFSLFAQHPDTVKECEASESLLLIGARRYNDGDDGLATLRPSLGKAASTSHLALADAQAMPWGRHGSEGRGAGQEEFGPFIMPEIPRSEIE